MMLHALLVFLHVTAIAAWLAASLWISGDVRRALALGRPHVDALAARLRPALGLDALAAVATFVTGGLLMWEEQMGMPRPWLMAGILFAVARGGVLGAMRRKWKELQARLQAGESVPADDPTARRLSMLAGVGHALWLLALAGMVF